MTLFQPARLSRIISVLALGAALTLGSAPRQAVEAQTPYPSGFDTQSAEFTRLINEYRAATTNGGEVLDDQGQVVATVDAGDGVARPELKVDAALQRAAYWHGVNLMLVKKCSPAGGASCDHVDSLGNDAGVRIRDYDFSYKGANYGENVNSYTMGGRFAPTASVAFQLWKSSPGHNANMLQASFEWHGIARACSPALCIWVNTFGGNGDASYSPFDTSNPPADVPMPSEATAQAWVTRAQSALAAKRQQVAQRANNFPASLELQDKLMGNSYTTSYGNLDFTGGGGRFGPGGQVAEIRGTLNRSGTAYTLNADILDGTTLSGKLKQGSQEWTFEMTFNGDASSFTGKIDGLTDDWTGKASG